MVKSRKVKKDTLHKKLLRDMKQSTMQFLAIMLLCALGTWAFSGLDASWRMIQHSLDTYFEETNLADLVVYANQFSARDLKTLRHLQGVDEIQSRSTMGFDVLGLGKDTSLLLNAYDGEIRINKSQIVKGQLMNMSDPNSCMLDHAFADAHNLNPGDRITLDVYGQEHTFLIRALVRTPEHIHLAKDITADHQTYGFAVVSHQALDFLPFTETLIKLKESANTQDVQASITSALPGTLTSTRETMKGVAHVQGDVGMFRSLSYVFPALSFCVAAMVVMTTLTRMMENQRIQMGTLKSLGFGDRKIRKHYLSYALYPSLLGSLLGLLSGQYTLPDVLWGMMAGMYDYPAKHRAPISIFVWISGGLCVLLALFICYRTYRKAAKETTAALLRPKPPTAGSRILLERWTALWRRLSFNTKMVFRNLLRNKWRTAMSLVGILCCNMLVICTLGIQDSISFFVGQYYGGTLNYEIRAELNEDAGTAESYHARLDAEKMETVMNKTVTVRTGDKQRAVLLTVLEDNQTFMRLGKNQTHLPLPEDGVLISRKLAGLMDLNLGDRFELLLPGETRPLTSTVHAFADTNFMQSIFIGRRQWEGLRKGAYVPTALLLQNPSPLCMHQLSEDKTVLRFTYPPEQYTQTMTMMDSTKAAFSILSGVAFGLAFVICYNMGLINFTERSRDYATLKVLGYHQKEIKQLMMRENNLTTLWGTILGIWPGIILTDIILKSCETDSTVFASRIQPLSILIASLATFAFAWLVELLLTRKVKGIDMVEALKSVE